jgi:hypothetical protein
LTGRAEQMREMTLMTLSGTEADNAARVVDLVVASLQRLVPDQLSFDFHRLSALKRLQQFAAVGMWIGVHAAVAVGASAASSPRNCRARQTIRAADSSSTSPRAAADAQD